MYLVYSALALAEVFVLIISALALLFLIVRAIFRALVGPKDEQSAPSRESLQHLKRAGAGQRG